MVTWQDGNDTCNPLEMARGEMKPQMSMEMSVDDTGTVSILNWAFRSKELVTKMKQTNVSLFLLQNREHYMLWVRIVDATLGSSRQAFEMQGQKRYPYGESHLCFPLALTLSLPWNGNSNPDIVIAACKSSVDYMFQDESRWKHHPPKHTLWDGLCSGDGKGEKWFCHFEAKGAYGSC